ncbi:YceI-like domain-containing protein [Salinimicrobium catena]|uniref:YceI-like domain-containing protein n=1 Tax=Salinimicrobium catena TaxID=390640 RepID=A0A1H5HEB1_9FLAO|nr:YceI family protein [Salinimicrobium catena]SDK69375.1 YceI-like domain-containing protein [Salinimicrobium catena]SEE25981.1 YceI-like domain-containing protein [Salinimicrobium catena]
MKKLMLIALLLLSGALVHAQNNFHEKKVTVLPTSQLSINGDTNINKFECVFDTEYLNEGKKVYYSRRDSIMKFTGAILVLNTQGFDCGNKGINQDFHDLIKSDEYPEIHLEINQVRLRTSEFGVATICITMAGKQKYYEVPINIKDGKIAEFQGELELNIKDFGLEPPKKLFGIIVVKDDIEINFDLKVKK